MLYDAVAEALSVKSRFWAGYFKSSINFVAKICKENLPSSTVLTYAFRRPKIIEIFSGVLAANNFPVHLNACTMYRHTHTRINKWCLQTLTYHLQPLYGIFNVTTNTPVAYLFK